MLGHSKLSSTQIYTQVSIRMLKHVHAATHPAQLPKPEPLENDETSSGDISKEELFAALDLGAEEENQEKDLALLDWCWHLRPPSGHLYEICVVCLRTVGVALVLWRGALRAFTSAPRVKKAVQNQVQPAWPVFQLRSAHECIAGKTLTIAAYDHPFVVDAVNDGYSISIWIVNRLEAGAFAPYESTGLIWAW